MKKEGEIGFMTAPGIVDLIKLLLDKLPAGHWFIPVAALLLIIGWLFNVRIRVDIGSRERPRGNQENHNESRSACERADGSDILTAAMAVLLEEKHSRLFPVNQIQDEQCDAPLCGRELSRASHQTGQKQGT